jgi:hypothetical protein
MTVQAPGAVGRWIDALSAGDVEASDAVRTARHVGRWPQSGELIRGREALRSIEAAFPGGMPVLTSVRRIAGRDELWTVEGIARYPDAGEWFLLAILELEGDGVAATTEYFGQTLEAPAWRAAHVERFEGRAPPTPLPPAADLRGAALHDLTDAYARAMAIRDFETLRRYRAPGWTTEWPQSGERIPDHQSDVAIHADYPGYPSINFHDPKAPGEGWELTAMFSPIRVHGAGPIVVIEGVNDYPEDGRWFIAGVVDVGEGGVRRETHYWTRPFEAPAWRAPFVERYDPLISRG